MQLLTFNHREFPSHLNWQAVSFMRIEWPWIEGGKPRETYSAELEPVHFALVEDDLLISYASVIRFGTAHAGETYRMYGLGNVFTFPSSRKIGYGGRVVEAATAYIRNSDADVAALFTGDDLFKFYARHGWARIKGAPTLLGPQDAPQSLDALRMMLFVSGKGKAGRQAFETQPLHVEFGW